MSQSITPVSHHDVEIVLKCYELRREAVMRQSRDALFFKFSPQSYEDFIAVTKPDHPLNAAFRQVSSYWEMVYAFVKHGAVNGEHFMEGNSEGLLLYAKILPFLARLREELSPLAFRNAEWVATNTELGKLRLELFKVRVAQMAEL